MNRKALPENIFDWTPGQLEERLRFITKNPSRAEEGEVATLEAERTKRMARLKFSTARFPNA